MAACSAPTAATGSELARRAPSFDHSRARRRASSGSAAVAKGTSEKRRTVPGLSAASLSGLRSAITGRAIFTSLAVIWPWTTVMTSQSEAALASS